MNTVKHIIIADADRKGGRKDCICPAVYKS